MAHKFLIHHTGDHVGVAVTDILEGEQVEGVYMDTDRRVTVVSLSNIPLGHKIALEALNEGAPVLKYGIRVGLAKHSIRVGDWVHTHNIKTARW